MATSDPTFNVETEEDNPNRILIKVGNSSSPGSLAGLIAHSIYEGKEVRIRAIGPNAVNQAVKGSIIARGYVAQRGLTLSLVPSFFVIPDEVVKRVTSTIVLDVVSHPT